MLRANAALQVWLERGNITDDTCGKGEFSKASRSFVFVQEKFKGTFSTQRSFFDSVAVIRGMKESGIYDAFTDLCKKKQCSATRG